MTSRTVTTVLDAPKDAVFSYLSRIENLPGWASEFARELKYEEGKARVVNGLGEFFFSIEADEETGVIDMYAGPTEDELGVFPSRVVELPGGASAYSFTMFQAPGMPDELFESQYAAGVRAMIPPEERERMLAIALCGPRVVMRLERIGIRRLGDLAGRDPGRLMHQVNVEAGRPIWHAPVAIRALENLVEAAERERAGAPPPREADGAVATTR